MNLYYPDATPDMAEGLQALGFRLTGAHQADVAIVSSRSIDYFTPEMPHILIAHGDAADIYPKAAERASHPQCVGVLKPYLLPPDLRADPVLGMRYFLRHLDPGNAQLDPPAAISKPLALCGEMITDPRLARAVSSPGVCLSVNRRSAKPVFWGTTEYDGGMAGNMIGRHRKAVAKLVEHRHSQPFADYFQSLRFALVVISPWGWGEPCWRDWEGLLAGAAVVKPSCPWVQSAAGLYQSDRITWCRPDWSDLAEKAEEAAAKTDEQRIVDKWWAVEQSWRGPELMAAGIREIM